MKRFFRIALICLAVLALLAGGAVYIAYSNHEKKREQAFRHMLLNLPKDTPKECLKDRQMMMTGGGIVDMGTAQLQKGCPGYVEGQNPDYGIYRLGPYTFRVPREYMWLGRYDPDGDAKDGLYLMFHYPDMTPGDADAKDASHNIKVTIKYPVNDCVPQEDGGCLPHPIDTFLYYSAVKNHHHIVSNAELDDKTDMSVFRWHFLKTDGAISNPYKFYFRGNRLNPDYWLRCNIPENERQVLTCDTEYYLTGRLIVNYWFLGKNLPFHDDIRNKLTQKLTSFIINPPQEENHDGAQR